LKLQQVLDTFFLIILAIFINVNVIDDRFVSPLEDLSHQYQSYELEETTRILSVASKKQDQFKVSLSFKLEYPENQTTVLVKFPKDCFYNFATNLLKSHYISLPPPSLV